MAVLINILFRVDRADFLVNSHGSVIFSMQICKENLKFPCFAVLFSVLSVFFSVLLGGNFSSRRV